MVLICLYLWSFGLFYWQYISDYRNVL